MIERINISCRKNARCHKISQKERQKICLKEVQKERLRKDVRKNDQKMSGMSDPRDD